MSNELAVLNSCNSPRSFHMQACAIPMLTGPEEKLLLKNCQSYPEDSLTYQDSCKRIVMAYLKVVSKIALKVADTLQQFKEVISEGVFGILDAIKHFDLTKEVRFMTYAQWWIKYRVSEWFKNKSVVKYSNNVISINAPANVECDDSYTIEDTIADDNNTFDDIVEKDYENKQIEILNDSLSILSDRNREIVKRYSSGETLQQIANDMNISSERVRQVYNRSLEKLKEYFISKNINHSYDI